jgi:hypothetical protein
LQENFLYRYNRKETFEIGNGTSTELKPLVSNGVRDGRESQQVSGAADDGVEGAPDANNPASGQGNRIRYEKYNLFLRTLNLL